SSAPPLQRGARPPHGHATRIHAAGERLAEVVEQMIGLATHDGGPARMPPPPVANTTIPRPDMSLEEWGHTMRVLYVDDNESNRVLISTLLATQGIVCETADDGAQGVAAAADGGWDVILMDIQMPVMDGVEAARHIRALAHPISATSIIALTANTLDEQRAEYAQAGMDDCIGKPVQPVELFEKLLHWASIRRSEAASELTAAA
ncbi:MAG: response regulator, partial [Brevundimonas sp.]